MNAVSKVEAARTGVYAKIAAVQGELAKVGIAKNRRNSQGTGYNFRGIDDVYSALSPLLAKHGLVVIPRMLTREIVERASRNGGALFYVTVHAEFDFVSADDGTAHTAATFGEAMDSGDKATNKAMSAAYKYAAFMTFAIPTEGDNDADATTHEVAPRHQAAGGHSNEGEVSPPPAKDYPFPAGPAKNITELKAMTREAWREVNGCGDEDMLDVFLGTEHMKALVVQLEAIEHPQHRQIWMGDGGDNPGLYGHIQHKRAEFKAACLTA